MDVLAEERYDGRWSSVPETAGCSSGSAMVHYGGDVLEEPVVWTVANEEDVFIRCTG